ncbi:STAS domain-containing protein [Micromonospora sp. PPF5-17]|uniref:Anti-sigma factor antagonist n=1 Tax=Micromonospora solifontis TaxID=2487138 RepID=A0ABX9WQM6_9ACTN|nr:STAS domain-containing protein [Micromonospora sp. PPF5-17B]NES34930.1 STAS domain-containing protein [Micromonospora solifontis]NES54668.1 STAS domain-containing protein [Micromonospora sp. PPF5-6]RNM01494.1 anti-sigma factor antagonist [Micromonospora solifontis]
MPQALCHCCSVDQEGASSVFSATAEVDGDHLRVTVAGEVDMATADTMFQTVLREPARRVTLDLRAVTFFDSAAIHAVVRLAQRFPGALTVLPSRQVHRVLEISGLGGQDWLAPA